MIKWNSFFIVFVAFACTNSPADNIPAQGTDTVLTTNDVAITDTLTEEDADTLELKITYSSSYCNGAPPPEEILDELKEPKPFENFKFYLQSDSTFFFETDSRGRAYITVQPGKYQLYFNTENQDRYAPFDLTCNEYFEKAWAELLIEEGKTNYKCHIHFPCGLCEGAVWMRP